MPIRRKILGVGVLRWMENKEERERVFRRWREADARERARGPLKPVDAPRGCWICLSDRSDVDGVLCKKCIYLNERESYRKAWRYSGKQKKPCGLCGELGHYSNSCYANRCYLRVMRGLERRIEMRRETEALIGKRPWHGWKRAQEFRKDPFLQALYAGEI